MSEIKTTYKLNIAVIWDLSIEITENLQALVKLAGGSIEIGSQAIVIKLPDLPTVIYQKIITYGKTYNDELFDFLNMPRDEFAKLKIIDNNVYLKPTYQAVDDRERGRVIRRTHWSVYDVVEIFYCDRLTYDRKHRHQFPDPEASGRERYLRS